MNVLKRSMARHLKIFDPVEPGQRRRYCLWIAEPWRQRCPRPAMNNGQECWCRLSDVRVDDPWPWPVVPPIAAPDGPAWNYDHHDPDLGPQLINDEAGRRWLAQMKVANRG